MAEPASHIVQTRVFTCAVFPENLAQGYDRPNRDRRQHRRLGQIGQRCRGAGQKSEPPARRDQHSHQEKKCAEGEEIKDRLHLHGAGAIDKHAKTGDDE